MSIDLGIDLGTTNTVVAAVIDGKLRVVRFEEGEKGLRLPSVICNDQAMSGGISVGHQAQAAAAANDPEDTIYSIKRLMGARFYDKDEVAKGDDRAEKDERERMREVVDRVGYRIAEAPNGEDHGVRVVLGGKYLKPEEISAMVLSHAKEAAEKFFSDQVDGVVITVPAHFDERQRKATLEAGKIAGLKVKALLDEPTAAAMAVGLEEKKPNRHVLVFDLGGGTFDVSLLQVQNHQFRVKNMDGIKWLGGDDFDYKLMDYVAEHLKKKFPRFEQSKDPTFYSNLKPWMEEAKRTLSDNDEAVINTNISNVVVRDLKISREAFETMIDPQIQSAMDKVDQFLSEKNIMPDKIEEVLLVGGSTYVPKIRGLMEEKFPGRVRSVDEVDPMLAVAQGAAWYASALTDGICPNCKSVNPDELDACEKCGTELAKGTYLPDGQVLEHRSITASSIGIAVKVGQKGGVFHPIIPKSTAYPMEEPIMHDFIATIPNRIFIAVYAGENSRASWNKHQGNIVKDLNGKEVTIGAPFKVGLRYEENRILEVTVAIEGREPEINQLKPDSSDDWMSALEEASRRADQFLTEYEPYMSERQLEGLRKLISRAEAALDNSAEREGERVTESINKQIYFSDSLASLLQRAERLSHVSEIKDDVRSQLHQLVQLVKLAKDEGNEKELTELKRALEVANAVALSGIRNTENYEQGTPGVHETGNVGQAGEVREPGSGKGLGGGGEVPGR